MPDEKIATLRISYYGAAVINSIDGKSIDAPNVRIGDGLEIQILPGTHSIRISFNSRIIQRDSLSTKTSHIWSNTAHSLSFEALARHVYFVGAFLCESETTNNGNDWYAVIEDLIGREHSVVVATSDETETQCVIPTEKL